MHQPGQLTFSTSVEQSLNWKSSSRSLLFLAHPLALQFTNFIALQHLPSQQTHSVGTTRILVIRLRGGDQTITCCLPCAWLSNEGQSLAATSVTGYTHQGHPFYIHDYPSNTRFLVDTGIKVRVIPPSGIEHYHRQVAFTLQVFNGSQITTFGVCFLTLNIRLHRTSCAFLSLQMLNN